MDDDAIRIPLRARDGSVRAWAIVDLEDADLAELRWSLNNDGYARRRGLMGCIHRVVLSRVIGRGLRLREQCDHINCDRLDNRRANLRLASHSQNQCNRRPATGSSSQYLGVAWNKERAMWKAQIQKDRRTLYIGRFADEAEAARAYDRAARECHGEYARLNFPDGDA